MAPEGAAPRLVLVGSARLPEPIRSSTDRVLLVELSIDTHTGRVTGVGTTMPLPGYNALLQSILVGRPLAELANVASELLEQLRGPLLRPTMAALVSALSHRGDSPQS
jgi:hypothetical protein